MKNKKGFDMPPLSNSLGLFKINRCLTAALLATNPVQTGIEDMYGYKTTETPETSY